MIAEAFRVLKPTGKACFTVWGRPERTAIFSLEKRARQNLGLPDGPKTRNGFDFALNISEMKELMLRKGFTEVKYWYQACNFNLRTGEEFVNFRPAFPTDRELTEEETATRNEMIRLYEEVSGRGTHDLCTFEIMVILAYKA